VDFWTRFQMLSAAPSPAAARADWAAAVIMWGEQVEPGNEPAVQGLSSLLDLARWHF